MDAAVEMYNVQKVSLMRLFSRRVGIQILLREYNLDSKHKQIFYEEDIINMYPLVKHVHPKVGHLNLLFHFHSFPFQDLGGAVVRELCYLITYVLYLWEL